VSHDIVDKVFGDIKLGVEVFLFEFEGVGSVVASSTLSRDSIKSRGATLHMEFVGRGPKGFE
jgi:hypothetical protein